MQLSENTPEKTPEKTPENPTGRRRFMRNLAAAGVSAQALVQTGSVRAVSYTHLTLPTICSV